MIKLKPILDIHSLPTDVKQECFDTIKSWEMYGNDSYILIDLKDMETFADQYDEDDEPSFPLLREWVQKNQPEYLTKSFLLNYWW